MLAPARPLAAEPGLRPLGLDVLQDGVYQGTIHALGPDGLELSVEGTDSIRPPLHGVQVMELDVEVEGFLLLTWAVRTPGVEYTPFGPPWRHLTLAQGRSTVRLDFRIAKGWATSSEPQIGLTGSGRLVVRAARWLPIESDVARLLAAYDRANFWAPESIGHTTINFITPAIWSESRGVWLSDVVAALAAAVFVVVLAATRLREGRPRPALAMALAALLASSLWGAYLLVRFLPAFDLRPTPGREERIRENYSLAPDLGAMAALARQKLGPAERVGIVARQRDWFASQTLCFNLAPRPCVIVRQGEEVHRGISGVGSLRDDELDAIVFFRGEWTPPGFQRIAGIGPIRWLGRRRP
ncbi:MAG TPA: hypothetical protein VF875_01390 [Anaeromyxobacter sp.]